MLGWIEVVAHTKVVVEIGPVYITLSDVTFLNEVNKTSALSSERKQINQLHKVIFREIAFIFKIYHLLKFIICSFK